MFTYNIHKASQLCLSALIICFVSLFVFCNSSVPAQAFFIGEAEEVTPSQPELFIGEAEEVTPSGGGAGGGGLGDVINSDTGQEIGIGNVVEPYGLVARIINVVLSLVGVLFFVLMVYGGFVYMTAAGNEDKIKQAKATITGAVIGLVIILLAYELVDYVFAILEGAL